MRRSSTPFAKAFQTPANNLGFSAGPYIAQFAINPLPDGFVVCGGEGGSVTEETIAFTPTCDGAAGQQLMVRLFYWNRFGEVGDPKQVWIGIPLVEVLCTAGNLAGPYAGYPLSDSERLCSQIAMTNGNLGLSGAIYSFGTDANLPALVNCELQGARLLSFECQAIDPGGSPIGGINMNVLWSKFS